MSPTNRHHRLTSVLLLLALLTAALFGAATSAHAAALSVSTTDDSGPGSLRQAIADAAPGDTITFALPSPSTITLSSELVIAKDLTISGPGAAALTVSGNNVTRVFFINPGAPGAISGPPATALSVRIEGLTIANGRARGGAGGYGECGAGGGGAAGMGGGIFVNNAALTVVGVAFSANAAIGGNGGGSGGGGICGGSGGGGVGGDGGAPRSGSGPIGGGGGSLGGTPADMYSMGGEGGGGGGTQYTNVGGGNGGGFGGGGAGSPQQTAGNGGFGGGGGGAGTNTGRNAGTPGLGGMFGGNGGRSSGGGGAGLGGAIFVRAGSLSISDAAFSDNRAIGGGGASGGQGKGAGIFLLDGVAAVSSNVTYDRSEASTVMCTPTDDPNVYGSLDGYTRVLRADSLVFVQQPTAASVGTPIAPALHVQVLDQCRQPFGSSDTIAVALGANPGGATLGGTTSRAAVDGIAVFDDLSVDQPGDGYTLTATDPLLRAPSVTSQPFNVGVVNPVVTTLSDSGAGSLRQAIRDATPGSTITFAPELAGATISLSTAGDSSLGASALLIRRDITIDGAPAGVTIARDTADPNLSLRLFFVRAGVTLRLRNLELRDGFVRAGDGSGASILPSSNTGGGGGGAGMGGAIYSAGALIVEQVTMVNNRAVGGNGGPGTPPSDYPLGGEPNGGFGSLNGGFGGGGGGRNQTSVKSTSQFGGGAGGSARSSAARAGGGGGAGMGGAIFSDSGTAHIINSTFSGNVAQGGNGGDNSGGFSAADGGAGFGGALFSRNGSVAITSSTFANNTVVGGSGGGNASIPGAAGEAQGAVYQLGFGGAASLTINNTIVANTSGGTADLFASTRNGGTVSSSGANNILQTIGGAGFGGAALNIDPLLAPLAANGGATQTHALLDGSPAINAGDASLALDADGEPLTTDQRGAGFPRIIGGTPDIGAFEALLPDTTPPVITPTVSGTLGNGGWYTSDVAVSWTVADTESSIGSQSGCGAQSVTSDTAGVTFTCTAASEGGSASQSVTITRDATAPTIAAAATASPNASGWHSAPVTVAFSCADALSGVAGCPADQTLSSEGSAVSSSAQTASDNAGNVSAPSNVVTVKIDRTAPSVSVTGVTDGATYLLGAVPAAACSTTDALSGVATQATLALTGGTLAGMGSFTATCASASDLAGNSAAPASVSYTVAPVMVTRRAPTLNSGSRVEGPLWLLTGEDTTINGGAVAGDLLVPGSPTVVRNGGTVVSTVSGGGSAAPSGYRLTLNSGASVARLLTRTDPVALPSVPSVPAPSSTRDVQINGPGQSIGDPATIRNLTLNSGAGAVPLPAGTYGRLTANSGTSFVLGVAGASAPSVYNLQGLTLNGGRVTVAGPVVINLASGFSLNSSAVVGGQSSLLVVNVAAGAVTLNANTSFFGTLRAPASAVTLNSGARLEGALLADRLALNGGTVRATP